MRRSEQSSRVSRSWRQVWWMYSSNYSRLLRQWKGHQSHLQPRRDGADSAAHSHSLLEPLIDIFGIALYRVSRWLGVRFLQWNEQWFKDNQLSSGKSSLVSFVSVGLNGLRSEWSGLKIKASWRARGSKSVYSTERKSFSYFQGKN